MTLPTPSVEYFLMSPTLIVFGVAVAGVLVEAFVPRSGRYLTQVILTLGGLVAAFIAVLKVAWVIPAAGWPAVLGAVAVDRSTLFMQGTLLAVSIISVIFMAERGQSVTASVGALAGKARGLDSFAPQASAVPGGPAERAADNAGAAQTELFPLVLLSLGGMMVFPAANDLLTMFVALEVVSLPLYLMCGLARHRRLLSQEAALKYFLLGAFSSAFFLYGVALIYGATASLSLTGIRDALAGSGDTSMALVSVALLAVGLLFKVGAVPFHSWVPDVYQGAPTPITGFMASATKVAAFGALVRVVYVALPPLHEQWRPVLWAITILTMLVGTITAVNQDNIKRMLAYSSVTHAGFILTGVIADSQVGLSAVLFYLLVYSISTIGAFAIVSSVRDSHGVEDPEIRHWAGLGRRSPLIAATFSVFLLSFAGIPLTGGFIAKLSVFTAAAQGGATPLVIIGVISSGIAAYFYVRVIVSMFFSDANEDTPHVVHPGWLASAAIGMCGLATLLWGILPGPMLDLANWSAELLR